MWKKEDATHRCKICGALWRLCRGEPAKYPKGHPFYDDTWSLVSKQCGKCCDNGDMEACCEYIPLL